MMNVLVIGGSRFLGKAIVENFLKAGVYNVYVMNRGTRANLEGIAGSFQCDRKDKENFAKVLKARPWDIMVDTILDAEDLQFIKFVSYDTPGCLREEFLEGISESFDAIIRGNTLIEYVKKGHSKAEGMARFLKEQRLAKGAKHSYNYY